MPRPILESEAPQRSDPWLKLHIGRPTASEFHRVVTPARLELSKQRFEFSYRLAAERLLNRSFAQSLDGLRWIEVGRLQEPNAVSQYQVMADVDTYPISMILTDDERFGCSPDRLVVGDERHGVEIKSLFPPRMVEYLVEGPGADYRIQLLGQFWVGDLEVNDLFAYNEEMPPYLRSWQRREVKADIVKVGDHMIRFGDELDAMVEKLNATGFFTRAPKPMTVLGELVQAMIDSIQSQQSLTELDAWTMSEVTEANMQMLDHEQQERIGGMVAHKRIALQQSAEVPSSVGWRGPSDMNAASEIIRQGNFGG